MQIPQKESADIKLLLVVLIAIPAIWLLFLGWNGQAFIAGNDGSSMHLPVLQDLFRHGSERHQVLYRPHLMGGVKVADYGLFYPPLAWMGKLGIGPTLAFNLLLFLIQGLFAFLGARMVMDLGWLWFRRERVDSPALYFAFALVLGFAPILGWRLNWGHPNLLLGYFFFLTFASFLCAAAARSFSRTLLFVGWVSLLASIPTVGTQTQVYSGLFGTPILLGLFITFDREERRIPRTYWLAGGGVFLSAIAIAWPALSEMVQHALGPDNARSLRDTSIVYSYLPQKASHLLSSIFWSPELVKTEYGFDLLHDFQFPLGCLVLGLTFLPWRKNRSLLLALVAVTLIAFLFAFQIAPVSYLLTHIPLVSAFRCPHRAFLIPFLLIPILALVPLYAFHEKISLRDRRLLLLVPVFVATLAGGWLAELLGWSGMAALVYFKMQRKPARSAYFLVALLGLGLLSLTAFRERRLPYVAHKDTLGRTYPLSTKLKKSLPETRHPLTRVHSNSVSAAFSTNTLFALGLSGIDGYWYPTRRFLQLIGALDYKQPEATHQVFRFPADAQYFEVMRQLYNVRYLIANDEKTSGQIVVKPLPATAGPAWFSNKIRKTASLEGLTQWLYGEKESLYRSLKDTNLVLEEDFKFPVPDCGEARIEALDILDEGQTYALRVKVKGTCPLTLSTNYVTPFRAYAISRGTRVKDLDLFPAYGTLIGVLVPESVTEVLVVFERPDSTTMWLLVFVGWLIIINVLFPDVLQRLRLTRCTDSPF